MTTDTREVFRVLVACRSVELAAATLYHELAVLHGDFPSLAALWRKTGDEELSHAAQFTLAIDTMSDEISAVSVDAGTLDKLRAQIEERTEAYRVARPSVRQALLAAIALEEAAHAFHADQIMSFRAAKTQQLFRAMMAADRGHLARLRLALSALGPAGA